MKNSTQTLITTVWESPGKNPIGEPFISIKLWESGKSKYYYSQRGGVGSVAFILYDKQANLYGLINEFKPPIDQYLTTAFGGSIDSEKQPIDIVINEVREEAGFEVTQDDIVSLGSVMVSTQSNQMCELYLVFVNKEKQLDLQPENDMEALATVQWVKKPWIYQLQDWKAITILSKFENSLSKYLE